MSTLCEHNRKSWDCRLCKIKAAEALDALHPMAHGTDGHIDVTAAKGSLKRLLDATGRALPSLPEMQRMPERTEIFHTGGLERCPVPIRYIHPNLRRFMLIEWGQELRNSTVFYRLKFETPEGQHHVTFVRKSRIDKVTETHRISQEKPNIDFAEAVKVLNTRIGIDLLGSIHDSVKSTLHPPKGSVVHINEPCTIYLDNREFRAVREGDALILIDGKCKKLC